MGLLDYSQPWQGSTSGTQSKHVAPKQNYYDFKDVPGGISSVADANTYGMRHNPKDGPKGMGWLGVKQRTDDPNQISSELSMTFNHRGKDVDIPLMVPTLTPEEVQHLLRGGQPTREIADKAYRFGSERIDNGLSPFAD